ncbi:histidine-rich glycoprotein-like [Macrosteles quadrilineatus]|uniref:histidine-rich glycoprotein-like n=1 Tax=Macrosteles quadrilineatus TaxID=74068 RepID=UPI0023E10880|nr:histidine-rich glycoprotein-like [Macrosteles quadrilineatus]
MALTPSVACLLVLALASASPVEESRHQRELREHYQHLSYIADYSCHHPQARSVPVHELMSPYQTRGKAYFPEYTVLHRCDVFAGCCEGPKKCGPLHAESLHLPFKVTYLEDMGEHHKGQWEMEYVSFDNHTVCGCLDHQGLYKPEVNYPPADKDHRKKGPHREEHHGEDHHGNHHEEGHEHGDHHEEDHDHKGPKPSIDQRVKVKGSYDEEHQYSSGDKDDKTYSSRPSKRPDSNKKIDTLYITI